MVTWTHADVVVLTAIELEYQAVLAVDAGALPGSRWQEEDHRGLPVVRRELVGRGGRPLRVVVARAPDLGKGSALATLSPLVDALSPACIAMCGVCAGRPGKTALGDVVAGERLYDHDAGTRTPAGFEADLRTYSLPAPWKIALERFDPVARFGGEAWWRARPVPYEWQERWVLVQLHAGVANPRLLPDCDARCPQWKEVVEHLWEAGDLAPASLTLTAPGQRRAAAVAIQYGTFPDLSPGGHELPFRLHVAPIGSGSAVMEDDQVWGFVSAHMRKTLAVEMEAAALADVVRARAHHDRVEAVVMKGVMDFADHGRDDHFKTYAARASAECLLAFLRDQLPAGPRPDAGHGQHVVAGGARTAAPPRHDLFLAHAAADHASALALHDRLQPDVAVFLASRSLQPGDRWDLAIPAAQRAARATVMLISSRSDAGWYLATEIVAAIAIHQAAPAEHRLLPVLLEPGVAVPYGLAAVQAIDAVAEGGLAGVAARLREAVVRLRGLPIAVAAAPAASAAAAGSGPARGGGGGCDAVHLLGRLTRVPDALFERIVFLARVDRTLIRALVAPLGDRALDLAQLAALDVALCHRLGVLLDEHAPWTR